MQTWQIASVRPEPVPADAVGWLLQAPREREPAARMLAFLNCLARVDYLSLVEYVPARGGIAPPELLEGHARPGVANVTPECFAHYRRHFWREDEGTRIAQAVGRVPDGPVAAMHFRVDDIPLASWRSEIYDRAQLADRLSFFYAPLPHAAFAINLYRDRASGGFRPGEIDRLLGVAPLLRQVHGAALGEARADASAPLEARLARADAALRRQVPELSPRERAVCAAIACGISADGIAAQLDVAPSTVLTLRKRAYAKLAARGVAAGRLALAAFAR
jgi:DNA-binding CsgD family transcriptional regulator